MSKKIILPNQREVADLSEAVKNNGKRQDVLQMNQYWNESLTRGEFQQAMTQGINEALHSFLLFVGENFELKARTPLGETILAEIAELELEKAGETVAAERADH